MVADTKTPTMFGSEIKDAKVESDSLWTFCQLHLIEENRGPIGKVKI